MRKIKYMIAALLFVGFALQTAHADNPEQNQLVQTYFEYLKKGDTIGILSILAEPLLSKKRELLQSNPSYSTFLANHYSRLSVAQVKSVHTIDKQASIVDIELVLTGEVQAQKIRFLLRNIFGRWKIADEFQ